MWINVKIVYAHRTYIDIFPTTAPPSLIPSLLPSLLLVLRKMGKGCLHGGNEGIGGKDVPYSLTLSLQALGLGGVVLVVELGREEGREGVRERIRKGGVQLDTRKRKTRAMDISSSCPQVAREGGREGWREGVPRRCRRG